MIYKIENGLAGSAAPCRALPGRARANQARTNSQVCHGEAAKNLVCHREALRRTGGLVRIGPRSGGVCGGVSALAIPSVDLLFSACLAIGVLLMGPTGPVSGNLIKMLKINGLRRSASFRGMWTMRDRRGPRWI